jgi:hypothetical protein
MMVLLFSLFCIGYRFVYYIITNSFLFNENYVSFSKSFQYVQEIIFQHYLEKKVFLYFKTHRFMSKLFAKLQAYIVIIHLFIILTR